MKTVIALSGPENAGKTSTLKMVYELLLDEYPSARPGDCWLWTVDLRVILTIEGTKVGIESQGDPKGRLDASLRLFVEKECEVIVCATRTSGWTVDEVNSLRDAGYNIVWLSKVRTPPPHEPINLEMARRIVSEVKQVVAENKRLRESTARPVRPLKQVMDEIGQEAEARGMTPEILESLLRDK